MASVTTAEEVRAMRWAASTATLLAVLAVAAPAAGQQHEHGPLRPDPGAPAGAPPHWLPAEQWVFNHWLPYDEARLLRLLRIDRTALWRHLRDDRRTIADLARRRGWDVDALARALVAPRRATRARRRTLEARAKRTLTQGHLAQHVLFHTLHQEVLPQRARRIFGVGPARFRALRRGDLSPLEIARSAGRGRAEVTAAAEAALGEMARRGLAQGAVSGAQARLVLDRQRRQLARWLEHRRYNGPPPTDEQGRLEGPLLPHALAPSLSDDGRLVAFEQAQPAVPLAVTQGEIAVQLRRTADGAPALAAAAPARHAPCSAYASRLAGGGRVAVLEAAAGNQTFGKRYGEPAVVRVDLTTGRGRAVSPRGATAYHPTVSADGATIAYTLVRERGPLAQVAVWRAGRGTRVLPGAAHEPALSGDGGTLVVTRLQRGRAVAVVRDLRSGRERRLRVPGGADASQPVVSADGRTVALTAGRAVHVERDGRRVALPRIAGRGVHSPALSPDGSTLAVAVVERADGGPGGRPLQGLALIDLRARTARRVPVAEPYAAHPALTAGALAHTVAGGDGVQRVVVRDLATGAVRQVSEAPGPEAALAAPCRAEPPVW